MGAAHEVGTQQGEGDGVAGLRGQLQTLLEHLLKRSAVKAIREEKEAGKTALLIYPSGTFISNLSCPVSTVHEKRKTSKQDF